MSSEADKLAYLKLWDEAAENFDKNELEKMLNELPEDLRSHYATLALHRMTVTPCTEDKPCPPDKVVKEAVKLVIMNRANLNIRQFRDGGRESLLVPAALSNNYRLVIELIANRAPIRKEDLDTIMSDSKQIDKRIIDKINEHYKRTHPEGYYSIPNPFTSIFGTRKSQPKLKSKSKPSGSRGGKRKTVRRKKTLKNS